jgi:hypothetical protein
MSLTIFKIGSKKSERRIKLTTNPINPIADTMETYFNIFPNHPGQTYGVLQSFLIYYYFFTRSSPTYNFTISSYNIKTEFGQAPGVAQA